MADKQGMLKKNADDGFFADGDPLAELARIVNFDGLGDVRPRQKPVRREPEFNLEDELLKEFDHFEAPASVEPAFEEAPPVELYNERPVDNVAVAYAPEPEPEPEFDGSFSTFADDIETNLEYEVASEREEETPNYASDLTQLPLVEPITVDEAHAVASTSGHVEPLFANIEPQAIVQAPHPVFELEDELMREFAAFDARREPAALQFAEEATAIASSSPLSPVPDYSMTVELEDLPAAAVELDIDALPADDDVIAAGAEDYSSAVDTYAEDTSYASAPEIELATEEPPHFETDGDLDRDWETSYFGEPSEEGSFADYSNGSDVSFEEQASPAEATAFVAPVDQAEITSRAIQPVAEEPLDTVSPSQNKWSRQTSFGTRADQPAPVAEPVNPPSAEPTGVEALASSAADAADVSAELDPFDDGAFELDLSELELDLIEMEAEREIAQSAAPEPQVTASSDAMAELTSLDITEHSAEQPAAIDEPVTAQQEDYSTLPFDPSQVITEEEPLETIAELDVPEIPKHEHEPQPTVQPDYDIDIDSDIAHLFTPRAEQVGQKPVSARATLAAATLAPAPSASFNDPDEFEKALEEDFRRSLNENNAIDRPDRVALTPQAFEEGQRARSSGRRVLVIAASVAAVVMLGGAGVYAYIRQGPSLTASTGEPKVILADQGPVKVVPENKGGQTVPNQDKAVYDSVTGEGPSAEKQNRLVTSNEEPVDVVQRTLMPETMPMDDEGDQGTAGTVGTATEDTKDSRLLPSGTVEENITKSEKVVSGVAPRKVRTMIVRGDGTLVPRDEPEAIENAAGGDQTQVQPTADTTQNVVPERLSENGSAGQEAAPQDDIAAAIDSSKDVQPVTSADTSPVTAPTTDDAEQPLVADTEIKTGDDVAANSASDDEKPATENAAEAGRALQQAADAKVENTEETAPVRTVTTTTFSSERTPVPEARPVDQPVNVVGTVTEQGNLKPKNNAADNQVAKNDTAAEPLATTPVKSQAGGGYVIQIASLPSEAEAQSSYNKLAAKFAGVIGGRGVDIKRADIKNKGTYYRVRIPAASRQEAAELCSRYKSAGGSCLVSR